MKTHFMMMNTVFIMKATFYKPWIQFLFAVNSGFKK